MATTDPTTTREARDLANLHLALEALQTVAARLQLEDAAFDIAAARLLVLRRQVSLLRQGAA